MKSRLQRLKYQIAGNLVPRDLRIDFYLDTRWQRQRDPLDAALLFFGDIGLHKKLIKVWVQWLEQTGKKIIEKPKKWGFRQGPAGCDTGSKPVK